MSTQRGDTNNIPSLSSRLNGTVCRSMRFAVLFERRCCVRNQNVPSKPRNVQQQESHTHHIVTDVIGPCLLVATNILERTYLRMILCGTGSHCLPSAFSMKSLSVFTTRSDTNRDRYSRLCFTIVNMSFASVTVIAYILQCSTSQVFVVSPKDKTDRWRPTRSHPAVVFAE